MVEFTDYFDNKIIIKTPTLDDFDCVKTICEARFGEGYIRKTEFEQWVQNADFCKVAVTDGKVVGIVYLMPEDKTSLARALHLDEAYIDSVSGGKKVIHSRCAALDEAYEHRGIMALLHKVVFDNIKAAGFGAVFAPAWTYDGFTPMARLLDKFGFEFVCEKENLWYDLEGYKCIVCGGKCKCKASIYQKKY